MKVTLALCWACLAVEGSPELDVSGLHSAYGSVFPSGNRNAASHKWASYALQHAQNARHANELFTGFCPVSGSPVQPSSPTKRWAMSLPRVDGGKMESGVAYFCC